MYLAAGAILVWIACIWIVVNLPQKNGWVIFFVPAMFTLSAGELLWLLRWRLAIDERGVWRRRLWRWELWSWEDFASGSLKYAVGDHALFDAKRRRGRRMLSLGMLTAADHEHIWQRIERVLRVAEPAVVDEPLEFKRLITLWWSDADTIRLGPANRQQTYRWQDVESLEIRRLRRDRPDFRDLILTLPDRELHLRWRIEDGREQQNWIGPQPDALARYMQVHVPADRQVVMPLLDEALSEVEVGAQLRLLNDRLHRQSRGAVLPQGPLAGGSRGLLGGGRLASAGDQLGPAAHDRMAWSQAAPAICSRSNRTRGAACHLTNRCRRRACLTRH